MGTRLPSTSADGNELGRNAEVMLYLQQKRAWQKDRGVQGNLTASVLRYTQSGGAAYYLVEPSYSQTSGLEDMPCYVDDDMKEYRRKFGSLADDASCAFVFYDVPDGVGKQDVVVFDGVEYEVLGTLLDEASGRCEVLAKELGDE